MWTRNRQQFLAAISNSALEDNKKPQILILRQHFLPTDFKDISCLTARAPTTMWKSFSLLACWHPWMPGGAWGLGGRYCMAGDDMRRYQERPFHIVCQSTWHCDIWAVVKPGEAALSRGHAGASQHHFSQALSITEMLPGPLLSIFYSYSGDYLSL